MKSYSHFFQKKNINILAIFQDTNFNFTLANNSLRFEQVGPDDQSSNLPYTSFLTRTLTLWCHFVTTAFIPWSNDFIILYMNYDSFIKLTGTSRCNTAFCRIIVFFFTRTVIVADSLCHIASRVSE